MPVTKLDNGAMLLAPDAARARAVARACNFTVEWVGGTEHPIEFESANETIVLFTSAGGTIGGNFGSVDIAARSIAIVPAGRYRLRAEAAVVLATDSWDAASDVINPDGIQDERVARVGTPFARIAPMAAPLVTAIDAIPITNGNGRIRFLQTETMSINVVLYDGPRGQAALSPHSHADIEQGTLAIQGHYVHHLRTPWGSDAGAWVDDLHLDAGPGTLLLIPPELVHTTEGVGSGTHFLLDIFAPPRRDFIAKGWIANAADYQDMAG